MYQPLKTIDQTGHWFLCGFQVNKEDQAVFFLDRAEALRAETLPPEAEEAHEWVEAPEPLLLLEDGMQDLEIFTFDGRLLRIGEKYGVILPNCNFRQFIDKHDTAHDFYWAAIAEDEVEIGEFFKQVEIFLQALSKEWTLQNLTIDKELVNLQEFLFMRRVWGNHSDSLIPYENEMENWCDYWSYLGLNLNHASNEVDRKKAAATAEKFGLIFY